VSEQKARDQLARELVHRLQRRGAGGDEMLRLLRESAADADQLHFTPHLVTACRDAGYWPGLMQAAL
jgi:hypothetical protein